MVTKKGLKQAEALINAIDGADGIPTGFDGLHPGKRAGSGTNTLPVSASLPAKTGIGNKGAPKRGESFTEIMMRELERKLADTTDLDPAVANYRDLIVRWFVKEASRGNFQAFIELMNRTEGKVPDKLLQATVAVAVVPWDDDQAPQGSAIYYKKNPGHGEKDLDKPTPDDLVQDGEPDLPEGTPGEAVDQ